MKKISHVFIISIISVVNLVFTQNSYYEEKLTFTNGGNFGQSFGKSTAINGQDLVVSSLNKVHFYAYTDFAWEEYQQIETAVQSSYFGGNLQFDENKLFVSAQREENGKIYIYEKNGQNWVELGIITTDDQEVRWFGEKFHINDNLALIQASSQPVEGEESYNIVFLYQNIEDTWQEIERFISSNGGFGVGLSIINESKVYISDTSYPTTYLSSGKIHVYENYDGIWQESDLITPSLPVRGGVFGFKILQFGDWLFVSSPGKGSPYTQDPDYPGLVYVYRFETGELVEYDVLESSDGSGLDQFGFDLAITDSMIVVSSIKDNVAGPSSGSICIFKLGESGQWTEYKKICPNDLESPDFFGTSVNITNEFVFSSSPFKNNIMGAVYAFDPNDNSLHANFAGDVRNGNAPITVQFTSVPQGNPSAYEWDFNSDGFVDSTEPNPQFTYQIDGIYSVTLTVYDESGGDEEIKTDYIQVVSDILFGDVDQSGSLDVGDLVLFVAFVLGDAEPTKNQFLAGDVNYSGQIDIIDIVMVIYEILG